MNYIPKSFLHALGTVAYILAVALLMSNGERLFGGEENFLVPVFMLTLFVASACITGLLVLGRPIHLYLGGSKKEAFTFLFATVGWLLGFAIIFALLLVIF